MLRIASSLFVKLTNLGMEWTATLPDCIVVQEAGMNPVSSRESILHKTACKLQYK
jgi:hypothetical protein